MNASSETQAPSRLESTPRVEEVDARTVHQWHTAGNCIIVDVREPDEHAREHIPGSRLLPLSRFDPALIEARPGQRVVLHCRSGRRSAEAARSASVLTARGVTVVCLRDGIEGWKAATLPVTVDRTRSRLGVLQQTQLTIGLGVLTGLALGYFLHPAGFLLSALFGGGLTMAGLTGACPLAGAIARLPWNRACTDGQCRPNRAP